MKGFGFRGGGGVERPHNGLVKNPKEQALWAD